jgi:hypothetical protein
MAAVDRQGKGVELTPVNRVEIVMTKSTRSASLAPKLLTGD